MGDRTIYCTIVVNDFSHPTTSTSADVLMRGRVRGQSQLYLIPAGTCFAIGIDGSSVPTTDCNQTHVYEVVGNLPLPSDVTIEPSDDSGAR